VGGGIAAAQHLVVATADDFACGRDDDCADRNFAGSFGGVGFGEREAHKVEIGRGNGHPF
jgi:hypothetical protein